MSLRPPTMEPPRFERAPEPVRPATTLRRRLIWIIAGAVVLALGFTGALTLLLDRTPEQAAGPPADTEPAPAPEPEPEAPEPADAEPAPEPEAPEPADAEPAPEPEAPAPAVVFGEEPRANWDVTGVALDDVLNVRSGPGVHNPVIDRLPPYTIELESTGGIATVDGGRWREIVVPGATTGWVHAGYLSETAPVQLPLPVLTTIDRIRDAAAAGDWDRLAELAVAGDTPFTAVIDGQLTREELAAHWRVEAQRQPLAAILLSLVRLPEWYEQDAVGDEPAEYATPSFMYEPTAANREALERVLGADLVESWIAPEGYIGWRLGIAADGDWRFLVVGD